MLQRVNLYFFFYVVTVAQCQKNNMCNRFYEYRIKDISPNCWYNPDAEARMIEIAERYGYQIEEYKVTTEDFFVLTVFRIPPKNGDAKGIVFLQHPALGSSTVWTVTGNDSFAFQLSDAGFDVWLGNFRGTSYSDRNLKLSKDLNPKEYWNYSFHEFGIYDLPAQINLVRKKTGNNKKVIYIGHSVGTTSALIYSSLKPEEAGANLELLVLWSPIAFLSNVKTPARILAPFTSSIQNFLELLGVYGITYDGPSHKFLKKLCLSMPSYFPECSLSIDVTVGPQYKHGNPPILPLLFYQSFEGFSIKALAHFGQLVNAKNRFQMFDYGAVKNLIIYNSILPNEYPLGKINVPVKLIYGGNDYFATEKDAYILYKKLPSHVKLGIEKVNGYSHFDFHYGKDLDKLVHTPVLKYIETYLNKKK